MSCIYCDGSGCNMCKPKGWITICGAGMVHPNVLRICGYDPDEWQGFAFGFGALRLAMLKYNMNDMRIIHENDLRETVRRFLSDECKLVATEKYGYTMQYYSEVIY